MEKKTHLLSVNGNLVQTCTILETNVGKFPCHKLACVLGKYRETVELNRKNVTGKVELDLKAAHYILNKEEQNLMIDPVSSHSSLAKKHEHHPFQATKTWSLPEYPS